MKTISFTTHRQSCTLCYTVYQGTPPNVTFEPLTMQVNIGPLLCHVTHDDFNSLILPAVQKSLLRNPEIVLECKYN